MGPTWKQQVLSTLLGATMASGLTTLILILVEATSVLLPTDTKVGPGLGQEEAGQAAPS